MGGSDADSFFSSKSPAELREYIRRSEEKSIDADFEAAVSQKLAVVLSEFNDRDTESINARIAEVKELLSAELEQTVETIYGGSISKHTYVDGVSDIDALLLLKSPDIKEMTPDSVIKYFGELLQSKLGNAAIVRPEKLCITVEYTDGMKVELLPAIRDGDRYLISDSSGNEWSKIDPRTFASELQQCNDRVGGKLIPTIKLAKAVNSQLPEQMKVSGYHLEAMACAAFEKYDGAYTYTAMLRNLFEKAADIVRSPMHDLSGQSKHVDEYLGGADSAQRTIMSHLLKRLSVRMRAASANRSESQWLALLGEGGQ